MGTFKFKKPSSATTEPTPKLVSPKKIEKKKKKPASGKRDKPAVRTVPVAAPVIPEKSHIVPAPITPHPTAFAPAVPDFDLLQTPTANTEPIQPSISTGLVTPDQIRNPFADIFSKSSASPFAPPSTMPSQEKRNSKVMQPGSDLTPSKQCVQGARQNMVIEKRLFELLGLPADNYKVLPSANPVSLTRDDFRLLRNRYVCSPKADGVKYYLFLTREMDEPVALMINRALEKFPIEIACHADYYKGTVLDGEYVWDSERKVFTYLIYDIMAIEGRSTCQWNHNERTQKISTLLVKGGSWKYFMENKQKLEENVQDKKIISLHHKDKIPVLLEQKKFYKIAEMKDALKETKFACDGLVFMPTDLTIQHGHCRFIFKLKYEHTVDFKIQLSKFVIGPGDKLSFSASLGYSNNRNVEGYVKTLPELDAVSEFYYDRNGVYKFEILNNNLLCELADQHKTSEVFCSIAEFKIGEINDRRVKVELMRMRTDKSEPNTWSTIKNTLDDVKRSVTIEDLCSYLKI